MLNAGIFLLLLFIIPKLLKNLGIPYILSFLMLGLVGKKFLNKETVEQFEIFEISAISLLFFFIGLEYSFEKLKGMFNIWRAGFIGFFINFVPIFFISYIFTKDILFSLIISCILYPTSTSIIAKLLMDYKRLVFPEAEFLIGVLIFEDLVSIVLLSLLTPISLGFAFSVFTPFKSILFVALVFGLFYVINNYIVPKGLPVLNNIADDNLFPFFVLGILLTLSGFGQHMGISEAIIAFMLGVLVPEGSKFFRAIETQISSLKEISIGVFFFFFTFKSSISLDIDYSFFFILVVFALLLKFLSTYLGGIAYGLRKRAALRAALSFLPRGEFSVIFASMYPPTQSITVLLVLITAFFGTLSFVFAPRLAEKIYPTKKPLKVPPEAP